MRKPWKSDPLGPVVLALTVGPLGGLGAILFRQLIDLAGRFFFEGGSRALPFLGDCYVILLPAIGVPPGRPEAAVRGRHSRSSSRSGAGADGR